MDRITKQEAFLRSVVNTKQKKDKIALIENAKPRQLDALCEIILNVLCGTVPLTTGEKKKASKHKVILRKLAKRCLKKLPRKRMLIRYFTVIRQIITTVLPIIGIVLAAV